MNASSQLPPCAGCQRRDREIARLQAALADFQQRFDRLQQQVDDVQRDHKRQAAPSRRRKLVDRPKKPGRPPGHPPAERPLPEQVDRILAASLDHCPDCQVPL